MDGTSRHDIKDRKNKYKRKKQKNEHFVDDAYWTKEYTAQYTTAPYATSMNEEVLEGSRSNVFFKLVFGGMVQV